MMEQQCKFGCCVIQFCPLIAAFARTIHSFQGQESGKGKPVECLIVNPGTKQFETLNPGTIYCAVTREITLGQNHKHNSAICFIGPICTDRSMNLIYASTGQKLKSST